MKLQRKNKYSKRITAGLIALLISASLLAGCVEDEAVDESAVVVEETEEPVKETPLIKDENYYLNYYKLSDEEVEKELENYEFKYPNATWRMNQINTVTLLDEFHEYKVLQVIQRPDEKNNLIHIYDLFTEEHLFDIPYVEQNILINTDFANWDLTKISNKIPYFDDKYIISMGICISSCLFVTNNLFALSQKDNINYLDPGFAPASILYPESFNDGDLHFNVQDIAKAYIKAVPKEIRVNTKKLGVTPTYREEDKYQDYWKINEDEIQLRLEKFKIASPDKSLKANVAKTLALKDANDCYKILNVIIQENGDMQEFYDLYSGLYLFSIVNNRDNTFDVYDGYTGYKFDSIINIEEIILPDSIESIGRSAFSKCKSLESIVIPESVTSIGEYIFSGLMFT